MLVKCHHKNLFIFHSLFYLQFCLNDSKNHLLYFNRCDFNFFNSKCKVLLDNLQQIVKLLRYSIYFVFKIFSHQKNTIACLHHQCINNTEHAQTYGHLIKLFTSDCLSRFGKCVGSVLLTLLKCSGKLRFLYIQKTQKYH